jgi:hypothetical protein
LITPVLEHKGEQHGYPRAVIRTGDLHTAVAPLDLGGPEAVAVLRRGDTDQSVKRPPQGLGGAETIPPGDAVQRVIAVGKRSLGGLDPDPLGGAAGGRATSWVKRRCR